VRLRAEVLPLLEAVLGGGVAPALARTAAQLREDLDALDDLAAAQPRDVDLRVDDVAGLPTALRRRVLRLWLLDRAVPDLQAVHLAAVDALLTRWRGQGRVDLPGGAGVVRTSGRLVLLPPDHHGSRPHDPQPDPEESPVSELASSPVSTAAVADATDERQRGERVSDSATSNGALGPDHGYGPDISHVLLSEEQIQGKIGELAAQIATDYAGKEVLLVGVLKGAVLFMSDFARALQLPTQMEFMAVSSYGSATSSSGVVRILKDLDRDITGKHVLVLEDIIDSGLTLSWLLKNLGSRSPASLEVCALLRKPDAVKVEVPVKYVGFDIPNEFVIGYGLDYAERYRDLPYIATLKPEVYA
jgi:hypoxanthine phosphoribosyltransferase